MFVGLTLLLSIGAGMVVVGFMMTASHHQLPTRYVGAALTAAGIAFIAIVLFGATVIHG